MTYADKIYNFLDEMQPGEKKQIDFSHSRSNEFIEVVKEYIQNHPFGNGIEFCSDSKAIRKMNTIFFNDYNALRTMYKLKAAQK